MKLIKTRGRLTAVLLILSILLMVQLPVSLFPISFAAVDWKDVSEEIPEGVTQLAQLKKDKAIELWHYSSGHWKATVDGSTIQISDSELKDNIENLAALVGKGVDMTFDIPDEVQTAIAAGKEINIAVTSDKEDLFDGIPQFKIEGGKVYIKAEPKFYFVKSFNYSKFLPSLSKYIPFVEPDYGFNVYSIYEGSTNVGGAKGYSIQVIPPNWARPAQYTQRK